MSDPTSTDPDDATTEAAANAAGVAADPDSIDAPTTDQVAEPSTDQLAEPSTEKEPGEEPKFDSYGREPIGGIVALDGKSVANLLVRTIDKALLDDIETETENDSEIAPTPTPTPAPVEPVAEL